MEKKLQRDENRKMLAGVAAGLGEYFDIDVTWVRVIFILMAIFGLSGVLIYIILWIVVPPKPFYPDFSHYQADYRVNDMPENPVDSSFEKKYVKKEGKGRFVAGIILVALGAYFLMDEFYILPYWFSLSKLWPVILIVIGLVILGKTGERRAPHRGPGGNGPMNGPSDKDENKGSQEDQPLV